MLATGSKDGTARVWDPLTGTLLAGPITGHTAWVTSVAFGAAPDGRLLLATGSKDGTSRIWDPLAGTASGGPLTGHAHTVTSVAFCSAPDGRLLLATGSHDRTVRFWDAHTQVCRLVIGRRSGVNAIAVAGQSLPIADDEGAYVIEPTL